MIQVESTSFCMQLLISVLNVYYKDPGALLLRPLVRQHLQSVGSMSTCPRLSSFYVIVARHLPPESAYFLAVNRNKRSMTVNLKKSEGIEIVRKLVKRSDVL